MTISLRYGKRSIGRLFAGPACLATLALAGCNLTREPLAMAPTAMATDDAEKAHPIVMTQAPTVLDVYPVGGHIDSADASKIRNFVEAYQRSGSGRMIVVAPSSANDGTAMADIRRDLAAAGLHAVIAMGTYPTPVDAQAQPIKLTFRALQAKVATPCGRWPTDLVSASSIEGWQNTHYPNFGCAYQTALAAQVADPRDLFGAQATTGADSAMQLRAITNVRSGTDPGTAWSVKLTTIGTVGG